MEEQIERMDDGHNSVRILKHRLPWKKRYSALHKEMRRAKNFIIRSKN